MSWLSPGGRDGASAANPKFASSWGNARGECRIQSCTSKLLFLVWLLNLKFLQRACHPWDRNFKFTTLVASGATIAPRLTSPKIKKHGLLRGEEALHGRSTDTGDEPKALARHDRHRDLRRGDVPGHDEPRPCGRDELWGAYQARGRCEGRLDPDPRRRPCRN